MLFAVHFAVRLAVDVLGGSEVVSTTIVSLS